MARLGINASLKIASSSIGIASASSAGVKDLTVEVSSNEVAIASRGHDFKRYLAGQKDLPIDFNCEADAPCVSVLQAAYWSGSDVYAQFEDAGGNKVAGSFVVTKFGATSPVEGEEEYAVSLRPSASSAATEPTHTAASSGGSGQNED